MTVEEFIDKGCPDDVMLSEGFSMWDYLAVREMPFKAAFFMWLVCKHKLEQKEMKLGYCLL